MTHNSTLRKNSFVVCNGKNVGFLQLHALCIGCRLYIENAKEGFPQGNYEIKEKGVDVLKAILLKEL